MKQLIIIACTAFCLTTSCMHAQTTNEARQEMNADDSIALHNCITQLSAATEAINQVRTEASKLYMQYNNSIPANLIAELERKYEQANLSLDSLMLALIEQHIETPVAGELMVSASQKMLAAPNGIVAQRLPLLIATYEENFPNNPGLQTAKANLDKIQRKQPGQPFADWTAKTPEDKEISISDYVGKGNYVLIDFWASWCGPCRAEMPNVARAYAAYHDKGFEILGISLDNNKDKWKEAITALSITWPQMSDLKGWQCSGAQLYGISSIPSTILFDGEGRVVAADLRGNQLEDKLEELYSTKQ